MPFITPHFWYRPRGLLSTVLTPLSWIYQIGHCLNQLTKGRAYHSNIPVICIGNAIAGGGGKTPTVIALIKLLKEHEIKKNIFVLTRGYGGKLSKATLVDLTKHTSDDVGDEALLLAQYAPTIVSPNRADGAKLAQEHHADLIIMDDGLQNKSLHKDLSFLVIDRQIDFGNGKILPAGPLREPLKNILDKIDGVICIGRPLQSDKPVFESIIDVSNKPNSDKKYIGFAGLALPDKFKNTLIDLDLNIVGWHPFPDHHPYTHQDIQQLNKEAQVKKATLITTQKDYVRIPSKFLSNIETLNITLEFKQPHDIILFIKEKLEALS